MFTVCPKCALTLVVTPADLRIAQGYVRCGRCLNVFNALARLSEDRPTATSPAAPAAPQSAASEGQATGDETPPAADAIEVELDSITHSSGGAACSAAPDGDAPAAEEIAAETQEAGAAAASAEPETPAIERAGSQTEHVAPAPALPDAAPEPEQDAFAPASRASRARLAWTAAAAALALILALQIVNHYRDRLATEPSLLGPLSRVYSALGIALVPHWDVRSYDVHQLGATIAGSDPQELVVRASVKNTARKPLPMPLLRVILQDRFGNNIAARDVRPHAYLPESVPPTAFIPAGGRVDATVVLVDPGPRATGFEIDACLARSDGAVACAHEP